MRLDVYVERGYARSHVGRIETVQSAGERFTYEPSWLDGRGKPLSVSLPLRAEAYSAKMARPYFDGLLPEGAARESLAKSAHVSPRSGEGVLSRRSHVV